jgi:hypothetical protein
VLAGLHYNIIACTLQAAVRHPASARCGAAARGELAGLHYTIIACTRPAPCFGQVWSGGARRARRPPLHHHRLRFAGRRPAPCFCQVWGGGALGFPSSLASTTPSSPALCGPPSGTLLRPGVGRWGVGSTLTSTTTASSPALYWLLSGTLLCRGHPATLH